MKIELMAFWRWRFLSSGSRPLPTPPSSNGYFLSFLSFLQRLAFKVYPLPPFPSSINTLHKITHKPTKKNQNSPPPPGSNISVSSSMATLTKSSLAVAVSLCFFFLSSSANEVIVGGKSGEWKIPSSSSDSFTLWAQSSRFKVGDFLVFHYEEGNDSVLQVTPEAYKSCNATNPIANYSGGDTKVRLERPGPFYFISGAEGHCEKGQKLKLVVVTPRHSAFSPAPSPADFDGPAVAPTSAAAGARGGVVSAVGLVLGLWALF
ncbi:PREDICTED: early nodulin-like protein 1 [Tarenaya hassleriana]|uniref:early nodulin-like protein 1 n=1 Tax=Tarenaya hassleriana TaxID=28532 RepID=UPI0008FD27D1|nr:PREDICTED: early nodulin-like protein 1 [Tarenaya hassleriana]